MDTLFQATYSGVVYGSLYGLMALGLTLVWGSLRMLNLAHGALYLTGGYLAWTLLEVAHLPLLAAFALAVAGAALAGVLLQALLIQPILGKPGWDNASLVATVGVSVAIQSVALLVFTPQVKQLPPLLEGHVRIGTVLVDFHRLLVIGLAVLCLAALGAFLRISRHGLAVRAVAQDMDAARLMGVPVRRAFLLVMGISAGLAGVAGVLLSSIRYLHPGSGFDPMIYALLVTIFGGLGSVKGTVCAAYLIGLLESCLQVYCGGQWAQPGLFAFMIAMLIVRPNGLFGLGETRRL